MTGRPAEGVYRFANAMTKSALKIKRLHKVKFSNTPGEEDDNKEKLTALNNKKSS